MTSRGDVWATQLLTNAKAVAGYPASLRVFDGAIGDARYRTIAVVPDALQRFPRARGGEVGLDESLALAEAVRSATPGDALVAIVDLPGQAFGRREESAGIHIALAAVVDAYVSERRAGRQVFSLIVGKAISGGFLAHGMQAGWIGALDDSNVEVHVMSAASVARVTRSNAEEVERIARVVPATARDIATFASFGAIDELFVVSDPSNPSDADLELVRGAIANARARELGLRSPVQRLEYLKARESRSLAREVRRRVADAW